MKIEHKLQMKSWSSFSRSRGAAAWGTAVLGAALLVSGCDKGGGAGTTAPTGANAVPGASGGTSSGSSGALSVQSAAGQPAAQAAVGKAAPNFTLSDLDGKKVSLADFKGKTVVLEWFNPGCPFIKKSHTKGSLVSYAKKEADAGVVWLAINSSAPGKEGNGLDANREAKKNFKLDHPILIDESGEVGHMYGATNTPHMFVIAPDGTLVYRGAIDNSPDGEGESPQGGKLVNYVDQALSEVNAKKPVSMAETKAYGCGVKYAH